MTEDDLFYGGSFADAQLLVKKGTGSQFSFRFFVQQTVWKRGALEKELNQLEADIEKLANRGQVFIST